MESFRHQRMTATRTQEAEKRPWRIPLVAVGAKDIPSPEVSQRRVNIKNATLVSQEAIAPKIEILLTLARIRGHGEVLLPKSRLRSHLLLGGLPPKITKSAGGFPPAVAPRKKEDKAEAHPS